MGKSRLTPARYHLFERDLTEKQKLLLFRLGMIGIAILGWNAAAGLWEGGGFIRYPGMVMASLAMYATSGAALLFAVSTPQLRPRLYHIAFSMILLITFGLWLRTTVEVQTTNYATTDSYAFQDYASRLLLSGENPYGHDMSAAFNIHSMPKTFYTPLLNGDYTGAVSYPSLSFLVLVPLQMLQIPAFQIYFLFFLGTLFLLYWATPPSLRIFTALFILFLDFRYMRYALGGVTDIGWAFFLCLVIIFWHHKPWAAFWFGMTVAYKQQPWITAPFLFMFVIQEARYIHRMALPQALWAGVRFGLIAASVFLVTNLPFMIWDFEAWLTNVLTPFMADMIFFGQGLSVLTLQGLVIIPADVYSLMRYGVLFFLLFMYWVKWWHVKHLAWIAPAIILWFGHRSLMSYWYYYAIPLALAVLTYPYQHVMPHLPQPRIYWRGVYGVGAGLFIMIAGTVAFYATQPDPLDVEVLYPVAITGEHIQQLRVRVTNNSNRTLIPRISIQSPQQPYFWQFDAPPGPLPPDETAIYSVFTNNTDKWIWVRQGGLVTVTDTTDFGLRGTDVLHGMRDLQYVDNIPNGRFEFWTRQNNQDIPLPTRWGLVAQPQDRPLVSLQPVEHPAFDYQLAMSMTASPQPAEPSSHQMMLDIWVPIPNVPYNVWVHLPAWANQSPPLTAYYGFELRPTPGEQPLWVIFNNNLPPGTLGNGPNGSRYVVIQSPLEEWQQHTLYIRDLLAYADIDVPGPYSFPQQFSYLEQPLHYMNFRPLISATQTGTYTGVFGPVTSAQREPDDEALVEAALRNPMPLLLTRAQDNMAVGNIETAQRYYSEMLALDINNPQANYGMAQIALVNRNWEQATKHLLAAEQAGDSRLALIQRDFAYIAFQQGQLEDAVGHIEAAATLLEQAPYLYTPHQQNDLLILRGWVFTAQQQSSDALEAFTTAHQRDRFDVDALIGIAVIQELSGLPDSSLFYTDQARMLNFATTFDVNCDIMPATVWNVAASQHIPCIQNDGVGSSVTPETVDITEGQGSLHAVPIK